MYQMEIKEDNNLFLITVGGFFQEDEGQAFLEDYNKHIESINPLQYKLIVDSTDLSVSKKDMIPILTNCLELYMESNFKEIVLVNPDSVTAKVQLQRVAKDCNFEGVFTDTLEEAKEI